MRNAFTLIVLVLLVAAPAGTSAAGPNAPVVFDADRAIVYAAADDRGLLAGHAGEPPEALARRFLRASGRDEATVDSLVLTNRFAAHGVTHLRFA